MWVLPLSLVLVSIAWWENYVTKTAKLGLPASLALLQEELKRCRYKTQVSRWLDTWILAHFYLQ